MNLINGFFVRAQNRYPTFFILGIVVTLGLVIYPVWFTQNPAAVDNWFYWAAGDNPSLAYRNNFGDLYYLERYVLIVPHILFHIIFGPFYSQLAVGIFWLSLAIHFSYKVAILYLQPKFAFLFLIFFYSSRSILVSFGSNYHHPVTISLSLLIIYLLLTGKFYRFKSMSIPNSFLVGLVFAALANAYLAIASYLLPAIIIYLTTRSVGGRNGNSLKKIQFTTSLRILIKSLIHFIFGFLILSLVFEIIHRLSSTSTSIMLLEQLKLGASLIGNKNPWGSNGFIDFWTHGIFNVNAIPWMLLICSGILMFCFIRSGIPSSRNESHLFFGLLIGLFIQTLGYTNPFTSSWTACVLLPFYLLVCLVLLGSVMESVPEDRQYCVYFLSGLLYLSVQIFLTKFRILSAETFYQSTLLLVCLILFAIPLSIILTRKVLFRQRLLVRNQISILLSTIFIYLSLLPQSVLQLYTADNFGFTSYISGEKFYQDLSNKAEVIEQAMIIDEKDPRIWLTPDDGTQLASTRLYGYSLIAFEIGQPDCKQVKWALEIPNSRLMSFAPINFSKDSLNRYLLPCHTTLKNLQIKTGSGSFKKYTYVIAEIRKLEVD
jgi:hypothetical protein